MAVVLPEYYLDRNSIWYTDKSIHYDVRFLHPFVPLMNNILANYTATPNKSLLDLGCGFGEKSNVFKKIGYNVTGIDSDRERILIASENYPAIDFRCFKLKKKLPFDDNTFDIIFSCSVLQYLDHEAILNDCKRVLKPRGRIILIENLRNNPITRLARGYFKITKYNYQSLPYNHFTYKQFANLGSDFTDCTFAFSHLTTPLAHFAFLKNNFYQFLKIDEILLKFKFLKQLCWLSFFSGINNK